ncbi:Sugar/maltose fermentation stimulation protein homolog [Pseudoalteromonas luteoviolacea B = ATCC 29581]|nr:Sugar/maltose fermentation stimulation protein homolog [Pseudoalteromonas luteoviolacea B = ATCC 29581]
MKHSSTLQTGRMIKRYKRFLVDLQIEEEIITVHCANTGRMTGCAEPGTLAYFSTSDNTKRKYPHSLELTTSTDGDLICVNTSKANHVVVEGLEQKKLKPFTHYDIIATEVPYGTEKSRIDILLKSQDGSQPDCYIEVKSVTLLEQNCGYFPDAPSVRGQKHLRELIEMKQQGHRAVLLFLVMHNGINHVQPATHIDPKYAQLCQQALKSGVEIMAFRCSIDDQSLTLTEQLTFNHA